MASYEETSWSWTPSKFPMLRGVALITNATISPSRGLAHFKLCADFLDLRRLLFDGRSERLNFLLLLRDSRLEILALLRNGRLLLLDRSMFLKELIEQHCVDRF